MLKPLKSAKTAKKCYPEHIPVFRAPLKSPMQVRSPPKSRLGPRKNANSVHAKKLHGKGTTNNTQQMTTHVRTLRLLARINPVGQFGENLYLYTYNKLIFLHDITFSRICIFAKKKCYFFFCCNSINTVRSEVFILHRFIILGEVV